MDLNVLPDYLDYNMKVLFVGYNPGERSAMLKHHYAGYGNQFWKLLYESGLTSRLYSPAEDNLLLNEGYGLTNIVARPSKSSADLTADEMRRGAEELREKVKKFKPRIVCFLGKDVYRYYVGLKSGTKIYCGLIESGRMHQDTKEFAAYNPSGRSTVSYEEKLQVFLMLKDIIQLP